jgi:predicted aspartyl protease
MNNSLMEKGVSSTLQNTSAIHPTLLANVEGKQVCLMIYAGASSSYICTDVITKLGLQPARKDKRKRCIEQMYGSMTKVIEV